MPVAPAVVEVVTVIGADAGVVLDLELDVDVHTASTPGSGETATTSTGLRRLGLGDEVTFRTMRHEHTFSADGSGGTVMTDRMSLTLPGGPAGALVARLVAAPLMRRLLVQRAAHIRAVAESAGPGVDRRPRSRGSGSPSTGPDSVEP